MTKIHGRNLTKNRWYEMCYNSATEWEVNKMSAELDGKAMDNEWRAMQDELIMKETEEYYSSKLLEIAIGMETETHTE